MKIRGCASDIFPKIAIDIIGRRVHMMKAFLLVAATAGCLAGPVSLNLDLGRLTKPSLFGNVKFSLGHKFGPVSLGAEYDQAAHPDMIKTLSAGSKVVDSKHFQLSGKASMDVPSRVLSLDTTMASHGFRLQLAWSPPHRSPVSDGCAVC